jgi:hypothetical protein
MAARLLLLVCAIAISPLLIFPSQPHLPEHPRARGHPPTQQPACPSQCPPTRDRPSAHTTASRLRSPLVPLVLGGFPRPRRFPPSCSTSLHQAVQLDPTGSYRTTESTDESTEPPSRVQHPPYLLFPSSSSVPLPLPSSSSSLSLKSLSGTSSLTFSSS